MGPGGIHALALILWLVQEVGVEDNFRPGVESVLAILGKMEQVGPEGRDGVPDDQRLRGSASDGIERTGSRKAAQELLQALVDKMVATAP